MSDAFAIIPPPGDRKRGTCQTCLDDGYIEVDGCTCEASDPGVSGVSHEPMCGTVPCPEGCVPP